MDIQPKTPEVSVDEMTVVLVGDFNPKIFHPMWFAHNRILRESEAIDATIEVVHSDVTSFSIEWLTVQVLRDRFTAAIKAEVYREHLGDMVQNVFALLRHSPVRQMGLNASFRLGFKSEDDWHGFGHFLAPKSPWDGVLTSPGMRSIVMQGQRDNDLAGHITVTIDPDLRTRSDALVRINDHYESPGQQDERRDPEKGATWALGVLKDNYEASYSRSLGLVRQLISKFTIVKSVDDGTQNV